MKFEINKFLRSENSIRKNFRMMKVETEAYYSKTRGVHFNAYTNFLDSGNCARIIK